MAGQERNNKDMKMETFYANFMKQTK